MDPVSCHLMDSSFCCPSAVAITGNPNVGFKEEELEGDFDPQAYDRMMEEAFANDYYQQDEEEKPVFSEDEDIDDDEGPYIAPLYCTVVCFHACIYTYIVFV